MTSSWKRYGFVAVTASLLLCCGALLSACGGGSSNSAADQTASVAEKATPKGFHASNFGDPATGANKWLPLVPGTQWVREGQANIGHRRLPHRVVTTVTDVSKMIDGVRTVVVLDQDYNGGPLSEQALDYYAEDKQGNVWYLGSYTASYEGGQFVNASDAWLAGVKGSKPGISMKANPRTGTAPYSERTVPGIGGSAFQVAKTGQSKCVPFNCYKNVLVIDEGGSEYKYYAPGVGQIKTEPRSSGGKQEVEDLVNLTHLSPRGLAEFSAEALKTDKEARLQAPDVFASSQPAKRTL